MFERHDPRSFARRRARLGRPPCPHPARCRRGHPVRRGPGPIQLGTQCLPNGTATFDPYGPSEGTEWLLDYLGYDYFGHVEQVELGPRGVDAVFKQLGQLDQVRRLSFFNGIDLGPLAIASLESLPNSSIVRFQSLLGLFTADITPPEFKGANFQYVQNLTRLEDIDFPANISVTDADLAYLGRLTALTRLPLHDPRITDAGLASLKDMTKLKILRLALSQVSGAGLKSLRAMTELKTLDLRGSRVDDLSAIGHLALLNNLDLSQTPIDDRGLAPISGLIGLDDAKLVGTKITSMSYAYLKHLSKRNNLSLANTQVGDEGSAALGELKALTRLNLDATRITDVTLAHLAGLPKLQDLSLERTDITDRGLAKIAKCMTLKTLNIRGTKVSRKGLRPLQEGRPYVYVHQ